MKLDKVVLKVAKKQNVTVDELASSLNISVNKLLNGLSGSRLLAPEKITTMGEKLKFKKKDIETLHKIHNKKNFEKRLKQTKPKKEPPGRTDRDDVPIIT